MYIFRPAMLVAVSLFGLSGQTIAADKITALPEDTVAVETLDCTCVTAPTSASEKALGNISLVNGDVLYSDVGGYKTATAGVQLISGSQISVPAAASANILVGKNCHQFVPARSVVSISQPSSLGGDICVKITTEPAVVANIPPTAVAPAVSPIVPLAVIGGGAGLAIALGGGNNPVSP